MDRIRAVALCSAIVAVGAAGYRLAVTWREDAPRTLAPLVDEALVAPPRKPAPAPEEPEPEDPPEERAADLVHRYLAGLRAACGARDRVAAEVDGALDAEAFARSSFGSVWGSLSDAQRTAGVRDLRAIAAGRAARSCADWMKAGPRVMRVKEEGARAEVTTIARPGSSPRDDIEVVFVMSRGPSGWRLVDLVTEGVSITLSHRSQLEKLFEKNGGDPAPLLAKIAAKVGRLDGE